MYCQECHISQKQKIQNQKNATIAPFYPFIPSPWTCSPFLLQGSIDAAYRNSDLPCFADMPYKPLMDYQNAPWLRKRHSNRSPSQQKCPHPKDSEIQQSPRQKGHAKKLIQEYKSWTIRTFFVVFNLRLATAYL